LFIRQNPVNLLRGIDRVIARVEGWLIIIFLGLMVTLTFFQVILRGLFTHAHIQWANAIMGHVDWTEPMVRLFVLWLTFLGASLLTGENKHIKIDLMSTLLPKKWQPFRELILSLVCVIIMAFMVKASLGYIKLEMEFGGELFLAVPAWVGQLILPVGFSLILFRFFLQGIDQVMVLVRGDRI
jgi:TRAP-type C4-dicarboxylate transport system permease small subunit